MSRPASHGTASMPDIALRSLSSTGLGVVIAFFGLFLGWLAMAPLNGAVVAEAIFKAEGNRKTVQHPDGGVVAQIAIKEGDRVTKGEVLLVLESTQLRAEHDVLSEQYMVLRLSQLRLQAEATGEPLNYPSEFLDRSAEPGVKTLWQSQLQQLEARRVSLAGQRSVIEERIAKHRATIKGGDAQLRSLRAQLASIQGELETVKPLLEKGLTTRPRAAQLERSAAQLEGQIGEISSQIAQSGVAIQEQTRLSVQVGNERLSEIAKELKETQASLVEIVPKLNGARAALARMIVKSPYSGRVVGLTIFSVGGVVGRGEKILDIVPDDSELVVEAQVAVDHISDVRPGMPASVHLIAFAERETPIVDGEVITISADRLSEQRSGKPYFAALVRLDPGSVAKYADVKLYAGMPATVMVPTAARSALRYLLDPLLAAFRRAGRER